jgi:hypothetical protein
MPVLLSWISERAQIFRGFERLEHDLRIGSPTIASATVAPVALMRVVGDPTALFLQAVSIKL